MKISTKGRYALRLMLELAKANGACLSVKTISARQEVSDKYLEQIVQLLNRAGYVKSVRGAGGGYRLTWKPDAYTIGMILRLTEGDLAPVACLEEGAQTCGRRKECATLEVWRRLDESIRGVVDHMTLTDLVRIEQSKQASDLAD